MVCGVVEVLPRACRKPAYMLCSECYRVVHDEPNSSY